MLQAAFKRQSFLGNTDRQAIALPNQRAIYDRFQDAIVLRAESSLFSLLTFASNPHPISLRRVRIYTTERAERIDSVVLPALDLRNANVSFLLQSS